MSDEPGESSLFTFTAADGDNLAMQDWPNHQGPLRGAVVLVHGLGEHAGRYDHVAQRLNEWGFAVRGYDQYGHGDSGGPRGRLPTPTRLLDDLADVVDATRIRMGRDLPLVLLGHSMGGLVSAAFVAENRRPVDALVLSSPALDAGLGGFQKALVATLQRFMPNFTVGNGLDANFISHDAAVVRAYQGDPRVHDRISARLAAFIADGGPKVLARAAGWQVPTLLMYAGSDQLVNPAGSRAFAAAAPADVVTARCFEQHFHELFNEVEREPVFDELRGWLQARF